MSITNKGTKWEWKNSWYLLLMFVFPIGFIPFFMMYARSQRKSCLIKGFVYIFLIIIMIVVAASSESIYNAFRKPLPEAPKLSNYVDLDKYNNAEEYEKTEEYKKYEKDYKAYMDSDEYKNVKKSNTELYNNVRSVCRMIPLSCIIGLLILVFVGFFVDRPKYLRDLEQKQDRFYMSNALNSRAANRAAPADNIPVQGIQQQVDTPSSNRPPQYDTSYDPPPQYNPVNNNQQSSMPVQNNPVQQSYAPVQNTAPYGYDINTMSEEDFNKIDLLNVIDVKKIIQYRNTNGSFSTADEFFNCFDARPHVIAKLQDSIVIQQNKTENPNRSSASSRRFDL